MTDMRISQWITIPTREGDDPLSMNNGSDIDDRWRKLISPFLHASGGLLAQWGRVVEEPSHLLLVATWKNCDALDEYNSSPEGVAFWRELAARSSGPITTMLLEESKPRDSVPGDGYTEIVRVRFTTDKFEQHLSDGTNLDGMTNRVSGNFRLTGLYRNHPARRTVVRPGDDVRLVFVHYWTDAEIEEEFKRQGDRRFEGTRLENWHGKLEAAGAAGWEHLHVGFMRTLGIARKGGDVEGKGVSGNA